MLVPGFFGQDLFDDFFGAPYYEERTPRHQEKKPYGKRPQGVMKTDIAEDASAYTLEIELPGFKKEEITVELEKGVLTVSAAKEAQEKEGRYIRKERFTGACKRSFYVGEDVKQTDIKAQFADGVLSLSVPKKDAKPEVEESKYISIL